MILKGDAIYTEKLTGGLKNDTKNLVNFHASSRKYGNLHFDGFLNEGWSFRYNNNNNNNINNDDNNNNNNNDNDNNNNNNNDNNNNNGLLATSTLHGSKYRKSWKKLKVYYSSYAY